MPLPMLSASRVMRQADACRQPVSPLIELHSPQPQSTANLRIPLFSYLLSTKGKSSINFNQALLPYALCPMSARLTLSSLPPSL